VTGQEAFEVAAAVAAISGLAALLILCLLAVAGVWKLFRLSSQAYLASTRASLSMEELARSMAGEPGAPAPPAEDDQFGRLRQQAEALIEQQRRLQEMARNLLDAETLVGGPPAAVDDLEAAINRLDTTVGQMATSLANLIQLLERQQEGR